MKTPIQKMAYLCMLMLTGIVCKAQYDWWPIHPGQVNYYCIDTSMYQIDQKQIFSIYIVDSNQIAAGTNYTFNTYINQNINRKDFLCPYKLKSGPLGIALHVNDSRFELTTDAGMSVPFAKNPDQGDSIVIISPLNPAHRITITYTGQTVMNLYGVLDSIRVYHISAIPANNKYDSIILSKNYGLVRVPNIRIIEDTTITDLVTPHHQWSIQGSLKLIGNSELPQSLINKLSYKDCFDFEIGDVLQIKETRLNKYGFWSVPDSSLASNKIIIQRVIDKLNYTDSICYSISNESYLTLMINSRTTNFESNQYKLDTQLTCIRLSTNWLDSFPGTIIINQFSNLNTLTYGLHLNSVPTIEAHYLSWLSKFSDTCAAYIFDANYQKPYLYYKSLGGPYYHSYSESTSGSFISLEEERKLEYYSNNNATWGTPYPFPLGLKKNYGDQTSIINVYPNPASDLINIKSPYTAMVRIYDMQGKLVYENTIFATQTIQIPCNKWPQGIYSIKTIIESKIVNNKLVISR